MLKINILTKKTDCKNGIAIKKTGQIGSKVLEMRKLKIFQVNIQYHIFAVILELCVFEFGGTKE